MGWGTGTRLADGERGGAHGDGGSIAVLAGGTTINREGGELCTVRLGPGRWVRAVADQGWQAYSGRVHEVNELGLRALKKRGEGRAGCMLDRTGATEAEGWERGHEAHGLRVSSSGGRYPRTDWQPADGARSGAGVGARSRRREARVPYWRASRELAKMTSRLQQQQQRQAHPVAACLVLLRRAPVHRPRAAKQATRVGLVPGVHSQHGAHGVVYKCSCGVTAYH